MYFPSIFSKTLFPRMLVLMTLFILGGCGESEVVAPPTSLPDQLSLQKVVIALKANKNPASMLAEKADLEEYLSGKLERKVEVIIPTDSSVVVESFRNGTLDLGYLSSTDAARNLAQDTAGILLVHLKMANRIIKAFGFAKKKRTTPLSPTLKINPLPSQVVQARRVT